MIQSLRNRFAHINGWRGVFVNFILGSIAVLGHAPFYAWPITIVSFAFFMIRLDGVQAREKSVKAGFWCGFGFGFGYFLFGFYWIGSAFIARGAGYVAIMPFAILLFCAGLSLFWAIASAAYVKLTYSGRKEILASGAMRAGIFSSVIFIAEFARGHVFGGFPWNLPGYVFAAGKPVSQIASYVGIYGVSALVLFLSAAVSILVSERKFIPFYICATVFLGVVWFGNTRLNSAPIESTKYVEGVKLRIVHANIAQKDKFDPEKYVQTVERYFDLTMSAGLEGITHVIWPEGAVPGLMFEDAGLMYALESRLRSAPRAIGLEAPPVFISQTLRAERKLGQRTVYYNAAAAVSFPPHEPYLVSAYYDKQKLVPFGEHMPGGALAEKMGLKALSTALETISPGRSGIMPRLPGLPPVSLQICYEIVFPGFTPKLVGVGREKPEWILNLSNDSWYGNSAGPYQHINQARYRAIEQGLPVIRSTSGGISGVIDSYGRQLFSRDLAENGVLDVKLPKTLRGVAYNIGFNLKIFLLILCVLISCALGIRRARMLHFT
ncbi:MAG: apolipoprotein N-acyltransferase [Robiginitomaculum sp.]|nr:MAG: apolipoprotein N-acyltransferase [Robiginitomaculum sp.]